MSSTSSMNSEHLSADQSGELQRPVLRYHGGKWKLAEWIIGHMPPHRIYVEPFGGGASVLMRKPRSYAEVYNDRWSEVVNVFRVLRQADAAAELDRLLRLTPYSRDEFFATYEVAVDPVEEARRTILRSFAGFGSGAVNRDHVTGFRANSNRPGTTPAQDWQHYPDHIPAFVARLQGVVIEHRDALDVIAQHDTAETLFYVDPPYPHATRNIRRTSAVYAVEMSDEQHERLAGVLRDVRGMVMLSTYRSEMYDRLYTGWTCIERETHADGARYRVEQLWLNPACATAQRQQRLIA